MPTLVDELVVKLGFDTSGVITGAAETRKQFGQTKEDAAQVAKAMQAEGARAAEFFSSIKTEALALLGVFMGGKGIETFIKDTSRGLADLGREARNAGMSVQDLSAFAKAIERQGGFVPTVNLFLIRHAIL